MTTRDEGGCAKRAKQRDPTRPPRAKPCAVRARVNQGAWPLAPEFTDKSPAYTGPKS